MTKKNIKIIAYNSNWPKMFDAESQSIRLILGSKLLEIHHVGSTSVTGLASKNKIDIVAVVKNGKDSIKPLEEIGYTYKGEWNVPLKFGFTKRGEVNVNLHVFEENHPEIEVLVKFRDYLRVNSVVRDQYAALKEQILTDETSMKKSANGFLYKYTLLKGDFIRSVLKQAGFNRIRILKCSDDSEWRAARRFRNQYFFEPQNIDDPYTWTFNHSEHAHLALYKGAEIIGYAHIQFWPNNKAAMRIIVIDANKQRQGYGGKFLLLIEQWLKNLEIKTVHTESKPSSLKFYAKNSYSEMPFHDPDGHESDLRDVAVGKIL
ncbi:MAG: GNAT family N-acetyltransferase [Rickettsiales bacterium]|nr:GNAT family N-acetyltransferase [Rickettsiales bacterium]